MVVVTHQPQIVVRLSADRIVIDKHGLSEHEVIYIPVEHAKAVVDAINSILERE